MLYFVVRAVLVLAIALPSAMASSVVSGKQNISDLLRIPSGVSAKWNLFPETSLIQVSSVTFSAPPRRKSSMHEVDEGLVARYSNFRADRVLKYMRKMIKICRYRGRRDLRFYYEDGWDLASQIVYGPLPARADSSTGNHPDSVISPVPAGFRSQHPIAEWPLKKISTRFSRPFNTWEIHYETLECQHIVSAPLDGRPAKSRRCAACLVEKLAKKKKPVVSIAEVPRKKAVSA